MKTVLMLADQVRMVDIADYSKGLYMYVMKMVNIVLGHFCGKFITYLETKLSCGGWQGGGMKKVSNIFHQWAQTVLFFGDF